MDNGVRSNSGPRCPRPRLVVGHLTDFRRDPLGFLTGCVRDYGDAVPLRMMGWPMVLIGHPALVEEVLFRRHRDTIKTMGLRTPMMRRLLGSGLVTSEGDLWVRQRRLAQPAFHRQRLAQYAAAMVGSAERTFAGWQPGETRELLDEMMSLTLRVVAETLFGVDASDRTDEAGIALRAVMDAFPNQWRPTAMLDGLLPTPNALRFDRAVRRMERIIADLIERRRRAGERGSDLLSLLLHARDEDGSGMTDQQLRDEVLTFFFAGHETTALALTWSVYLLSQHPGAEARLATELRVTLDGRPPAFEDLPRLQFAEAVVREAMRLYPPVWSIGREVVREFEIGGCPIPARAQILLSPWVIHRDPRFYTRPEEFVPERWLGDGSRPEARCTYFPFGAGPRACIGSQFALTEATLLLASLASRFRFELAPGPEVVPWATMTLRPKHGLRVVLRPQPRAAGALPADVEARPVAGVR